MVEGPSPATMLPVTGVVLAGGRGERMGGRDKGLQLHRGRPLVEHALERLRPQVGALAISANRHLDQYRAFGCPVWTDAMPDHPGPLAGWLSALQCAPTEWVVTVPCDTPDFPADLVARLWQAAHSAGTGRGPVARLATAETPSRAQPVFALLHRSLAAALQAALQAGERRVLGWTQAQRAACARFEDEAAFRNLNTLAELD